MNARTRTVTMLATLLAVLTLAAACERQRATWVLWVTLDPASGSGYMPRDTFGTETACKDEIKRREAQGAVVGFVCLPDPVDPRESKGK